MGLSIMRKCCEPGTGAGLVRSLSPCLCLPPCPTQREQYGLGMHGGRRLVCLAGRPLQQAPAGDGSAWRAAGGGGAGEREIWQLALPCAGGIASSAGLDQTCGRGFDVHLRGMRATRITYPGPGAKSKNALRTTSTWVANGRTTRGKAQPLLTECERCPTVALPNLPTRACFG